MNRAQARLADDQPHRLLDLAEALALDGVAQQHLAAEIVPRRIEFEGAAANVQPLPLGLQLGRCARVDADAGQHPRQLLHILLRVAGIHAQRVQLHQLAGVVLIDVPGRVLVVVQVLQHRRMFESRHHQVLEMPEDVRPDRTLRVVADQPAQIGLVLEHAEMVEPEPDHLLLQLRRGIHRAQQFAANGLIRELVAALVERLARLLLVGPVGQGIDGLVFRVDRGKPFLGVGVRHLESADLCGDRRRQGRVPGVELLLEEYARGRAADSRTRCCCRGRNVTRSSHSMSSRCNSGSAAAVRAGWASANPRAA